MAINIGTPQQDTPITPTACTWEPIGTDLNSLGPENLGMNITDHTTLVGSPGSGLVRVGITPSQNTVVQTIATETTPLIFSGQLRTITAGPLNVNQ